MRKLIKRQIDSDLQDIMYGKRNLEWLAEELLKLNSKFEKEGYKYVSSEIRNIGYDGGVEINLIGYTLETDEEFNKRIDAENKAKVAAEKKLKAKEERDRKKLEQLKKQYGG